MGKKSLSSKAMADQTKEFDAMYKANQPLIFRFMFWRTKDKMLAEDLTSNVFEKAWRTRKSFTGGSAKAWLFRIARTTLIDYWRRHKDIADDGTVIDQAPAETKDLGDELDEQLAAEELKRAVSRLPQDMRDVVQQRFINGLTARETAVKLDLSEANVRVIQYRALKKLREFLQ